MARAWRIVVTLDGYIGNAGHVRTWLELFEATKMYARDIIGARAVWCVRHHIYQLQGPSSIIITIDYIVSTTWCRLSTFHDRLQLSAMCTTYHLSTTSMIYKNIDYRRSTIVCRLSTTDNRLSASIVYQLPVSIIDYDVAIIVFISYLISTINYLVSTTVVSIIDYQVFTCSINYRLSTCINCRLATVK